MASEKTSRRQYRQQARARQQEETRRRITEAVVELHERVGPVRTTISDVAELAGVGRMTVYKHFPTDSDLFRACGSLWSERNPPPDFSACMEQIDPQQRAQCVLERLYRYYRETHVMMGKILRDASLLPALQEVVDEGWMGLIRQLEHDLVPQGARGAAARRMRAAARVALDLHSWEILAAAGLTDRAAAAVTARWIAASGSSLAGAERSL